MTARVRTRGDRAYFVVDCLEGQEHRFQIALDGVAGNPQHDAEADAVIAALGGRPHPCAQAAAAYRAARIAYLAQTGQEDVPGMRRNRNGWVAPNYCSKCTTARSNRYPQHFSSFAHQAEVHGTDARMVQVLARWFARNDGRTIPTSRTPEPELVAALRAPWFNDRSSFAMARAMMSGYGITARFAVASLPLTGGNPTIIQNLRSQGIRVEWLAALSEQVRPAAFGRAREANPNLVRSIVAARNVDPAQAARYLNSGIHSHLHTYARVGASPAQVLAVYRATSGQQTLADRLAAGLTLEQALAGVAL